MQMTNARVIFLIVVSLVLVVFPACQGREEVSGEKAFPPARTEEKVLLDRALAELERSVEGVLPWLARLYDKKQKGFHLALSAWDDPERYFCGIEPTSHALTILSNARVSDGRSLLELMPARMKEDLVEFYQNRQDPQDGFFKDPDPVAAKEPRKLARATGYSSGALSKLGVIPLYPLAKGRQVTENVPELASPEAFRLYLESLNWDKPWGAGDHAGVRAGLANKLDEPLRSRIAQVFFEFLDSKQSRQTGMWGNDTEARDYQYVSGVMKLHGYFGAFNREIPMADKLKESIIWVLRNNREVWEYCWVRNPLTALAGVLPGCRKPLTDKEKYDIIINTVHNHSQFLQPDGGFSGHPERATNYGWGGFMPLGKSLREGDTNATTQVLHTVRPYCYELAGRPVPPMPHADEFYKIVGY